MKISIKGAPAIEAYNSNTATLKHVAALEKECGITAHKMQGMAQKSQAFAAAATIFLSEHSRGKFITWDEAQDYSLSDITYEFSPKEQADIDAELARLAAEEAGEASPTVALTVSDQGDAAAPEAAASPEPAPKQRAG